MSKAEKFIQDCTKSCSNEIGYCHNKTRNHNHVFYDWLSPDQALRAVEIEREEMINKFCEWLKKNATYTHPRKYTKECIINIGKLKDDLNCL